MFGFQKASLTQARADYERALSNRQLARADLKTQRTAFLARPANLLFPFTAGMLVAVSQVRNVPKGLGRLPFMNIAKSAIGAYALLTRLKTIQQLDAASDTASDAVDDAAIDMERDEADDQTGGQAAYTVADSAGGATSRRV